MKTFYFISIITGLLLFTGCKEGYLDIKSDQSLLVPATLQDLQALLDNPEKMNYGPALHIISTDDYKIFTTGNWAALTAPQRNAYIWAEDIFEGASSADWNRPYEQVFYSNVVLDQLAKIDRTPKNETEWNTLKGSALFYRAMAFFQLVNMFAAPYKASEAASTPGIPLKISSDVNERPGRGSVQEVYQRILTDLSDAYALLPDVQSTRLTRPAKLCVDALLARIHLVMGHYEEAYNHADAAIKAKPTLLDYNSLSGTSNRPISFNTAANSEVIYWHWAISYSFASSAVVSIAPDIVASYHNDDLRRSIFLRNRGNNIYTFKGNYTGDTFLFTGMAVDEMYLIRAECHARLNDVDRSMRDLNTLMKARWNMRSAFPQFTATTSDEALRLVLSERRKELITRGLRWSDLRRLNQDTRFAATLKRELEGMEYSLPENDKRYVFPIPQNEIDNNNIDQNER